MEYKVKEFEIETDKGDFKCTLLKEKCMNEFRINAKQISVKCNGENHFIAKNVHDYIMLVHEPNLIFDGIDQKHELRRYNYGFHLKPHLILSRELEHFKYDLIKAVAEENS